MSCRKHLVHLFSDAFFELYSSDANTHHVRLWIFLTTSLEHFGALVSNNVENQWSDYWNSTKQSVSQTIRTTAQQYGSSAMSANLIKYGCLISRVCLLSFFFVANMFNTYVPELGIYILDWIYWIGNIITNQWPIGNLMCDLI